MLVRDNHECQAEVHVWNCDGRATDVDHVDRNGGDDLANLTSLSPACHKAKTTREGNAAKPRESRPRERHPGWR